MKKIYRILAMLIAVMLVFTACNFRDEDEGKTGTESRYSGETESVADGSDKSDRTDPVKTEDVKNSTDTDASGKTDDIGDVVKPEATIAPAAVEPAPDSSEKVKESAAADDGGSSAEAIADFIRDIFTESADAGLSEPAYDALDGKMFVEPAEAYEGTMDDSTGVDFGAPDIFIDEPYIPEDPNPVAPAAGLLTAGEWNDNERYDFLRELVANGQEDDYLAYFTNWGFTPMNRIAVHVSSAEGSLAGAEAALFDLAGNVLQSGVTDNNGMVYLYYNMRVNENYIPAKVEACAYNASLDVMSTVMYELSSEDFLPERVVELTFDFTNPTEKQLDLMFVIDTTGSMGDEISYLQAELDDVIQRVRNDNANIPVRLSCNFYRDVDDGQDSYTLNTKEFSTDIDEQLGYLRREYATGGGDYPEAVEMALTNAIFNHEWNSNSIKLMFLVLDAPPHHSDAINAELEKAVNEAAKLGIRIIPVASSGVDKETEFLLRFFAMVTGGTYTFLTDDSGIGGAHLEPTIGEYEVEMLNDMLVRIISSYI